MKEQESSQHFLIISLCFYSRCSRAANSATLSLIWPNFELVRDFMVVLVTCKNEEGPIKMKALECSQHYTTFFRRSMTDNSGVGGGILPKFEVIQAFMHVLVTCQNEKKNQSNMKELEWSQHFSHYKSMGIFPGANSAVHSPFWPNFELVRDVMVVLIACKNEEDPIKMKALECSQQYISIFRRWWYLAENQTHPSFHACPRYLQE